MIGNEAESKRRKADTDADNRWNAIVNRDVRADGLFFFGVKSTRIYCRPSCPARRPKRANVVFFDDAASARAAGFRPCKRCAPDHVSDHLLLAIKALQIIAESETSPTLSEIADTLRVSPYHLQRVFKRLTGLSPKEAALALKAERFEDSLQSSPSVLDAMFDAGYGSSRALYERVQKHLGMRPSTYRRGGESEQIRFTIADTSLGRMLAAMTDLGICALWWGDDEELTTTLHARFSRATIVRDDEALAPLAQSIEAYLNDGGLLPNEAIDARGTEFQRKVWQALIQIPIGETRTYTQVAHMIGQPKAVRAVASACAANPVALLIPCHRVIRSSGELANYRWGIERKKALLAREREHRSVGQAIT